MILPAADLPNAPAPRPAPAWPNQVAIAAVLVLAMVLGGGGGPWPLPETIVYCSTAAIAAVLIWRGDARGRGHTPRQALLAASLVLFIPAIQLVPLPGTWWQALPGRETEARILALVAASDTWQPWTISRTRTLAALLACLPPAGLMILISRLPSHHRWVVAAVIAATSVVSLVVGLAQMMSPLDAPIRFYQPKSGWLHGFEANHNSQADVLTIGLFACAALASDAIGRRWLGKRTALLLAAAAAGLLSLGIVLTASRTGMVLLPLALAWGTAIVWPELRSLRPSTNWLVVAVAGLAAVGLAIAQAWSPLNLALARFDFAGEKRPEIWRDSWRVVEFYWPFGSGAGTFVPAFAPFERVEALYQFPVMHAHNELLELAIEAGVLGIVAAAAVVAILLLGARRSLRNGDSWSRTSTYFAGGALSVVALHSLVDYPLRSLSVACMIGACAGLLLTPTSGGDRFARRKRESP